MKKYNLLIVLIAFLSLSACKGKETVAETTTKNTIAKTVESKDPTNTIVHTLDNGLKIYMSVNKEEPRIQSSIAVRAGSKYDPAETTGLAHYLEHMMFKGTHKIGTKDWEKEKVILEQIAEKFEEHKNTKDAEKKKAIYKEIDKLSYEASKLAIANEYDKMVSALGAKGTNAYTSNDRTVYINDIPANELEKFLKIEGERFQTLVLRLFHTELETVYEEFNRSQDNDGRWVYQKVMEGLFPNHPYGTQTTIGVGEHLKNPSMYNIIKYYETYYRPNNIAICLSGDLDPEKTIAMVQEYFGNWKPAEIPAFKMPEDKPLAKPLEKETFGPQQEVVYVGFKFKGAGTKEATMLKIVDMLLANSQAGLIDINLKLNQKVLSAGSFPNILDDYSAHFLYGVPKQGQKLEEVKDLLLDEIGKIKKGEFEDWLIQACINDLKLNRIEEIESNGRRAALMVDAFINQIPWQEYITEYDRMEEITKQDIINFANQHYKENYVVSYKRMGDAKRHSVPKPKITQLDLDRESTSPFFDEISKMQGESLKPEFINYKEAIQTTEVNGYKMSYVKNKNNELFDLSYIFDMGTDHSKTLALAIGYLPYLGTEKYTAAQLQQEFYKLGLRFNVNTSRERAYISLSGLDKNFEEGVKLFEHILSNVKADKTAYQNLVASILKSRKDAKLDKNTILRSGLVSIAKYGKQNPFNDILSEAELKAIDVEKLVEQIKSLTQYPHRIFYYGQEDKEVVVTVLQAYHKAPAQKKQIPAIKKYETNYHQKPKVYFAPYDMQQVELYLVATDGKFDKKNLALGWLFNEYFGAGLSSIVFQEIREKQALAYSAYSYYSNAPDLEKENYLYAYIGTQADKLDDAIKSMQNLLNNMPKAQIQFNAAKEAALKKIESGRTTGSSIYWAYEKAQKRGLDYDINKEIYQEIQKMSIEDLADFFNKHIKNKTFAICIIGDKSKLNKASLKSMGEVVEFDLEELFGY